MAKQEAVPRQLSSEDPTAPTAMLLQGPSAPPTTTTPHEQGSNTSPTATSART
jgi:hypothetical protein